MRVAEFFAGIGLVRMGLEAHGLKVVWANDIDVNKHTLYVANFDASDFRLDDIRNVRGWELPDIDLATASFPCTDLSLAGNRAGLHGIQSSMFWEFARVLDEVENLPSTILIENVPSFASSHAGQDLRSAISKLNRLGYWCDLLVINARHFVPQSRARLFIVGSVKQLGNSSNVWEPSEIRPAWIQRFVNQNPSLRLHALDLTLPPPTEDTLADIVERLSVSDERWWDAARYQRFLSELSPAQQERLKCMTASDFPVWATAYRRTRYGRPAWEIRGDAISGCLRTARGGSSRQALVEAGLGVSRVRWMTSTEYARLQGAEGYEFASVPENRALFGFGDAVCVPVVAWLAQSYLIPLLQGTVTTPVSVAEGTFAVV
jgi:DNA (cytosine-5)-methyltransferase 1